MEFRARTAVHVLRQNVWVVPAACTVAAGLLSYATQAVDEILERRTAWYLFAGGPDGARAVLSTVAASVMTFTGLVFSVTMLVLQLASSQFSPRVLRTFLQDRPTKMTLGIFVGTFVYALLGIRQVRGEADDITRNVPGLTVWFAVILAIGCVGAFVYYIHHIAQSIRAINVLARIGGETRSTLDTLFPEGIGNDPGEAALSRPHGPPSAIVVHERDSGVLMNVDEERLWALANECGVALALVPMMGDFVRQGGPLFEIWGDASKVDARALHRAVRLGAERSMLQDVGFGLRQLVDVAERALSPSVNDPTTAVQALDQIHDVLGKLVRRRFPSGTRTDDAGRPRLVFATPQWPDFVHLGVDEIRRAGATSMQVHRRLRFMLEDLRSVAPPFRRDALDLQLELLEKTASQRFEHAADIDRALRSSPQGNGPLSGAPGRHQAGALHFPDVSQHRG